MPIIPRSFVVAGAGVAAAGVLAAGGVIFLHSSPSKHSVGTSPVLDAPPASSIETPAFATPETKQCWQRGPAKIDQEPNNWPTVFTMTVQETSATGTDNGRDDAGLNGSPFGRDIGDPKGTSRTTRLTWDAPPAVLCAGDSVSLSSGASGDSGGLFGVRYKLNDGLDDAGYVVGSYLPGDFVWVRYDLKSPAATATLTVTSDTPFSGANGAFNVSVDITAPHSDASVHWFYEPGGSPAPDESEPLIFVPGVTGSQLAALNGDILWPPGGPGANRSVDTTPLRDDFRRLSLNPATGPHETLVASDVIREDGPSSPVYGPLLTYLKTAGGYREYTVNGDPRLRTQEGCDMTQQDRHPNLFVFAYDWRLDNADSAAALARYVACAQRLNPNKKVNILTHSMGGLVARRFIIDHPGKVDKLITVAAPWLGSPKPLYQALQGTTGIALGDEIAGAIYGTQLREMLTYYPGIHELMATSAYFDLGGRPYSVQLINDGEAQDVATFGELMGPGGIVDKLFPELSYNGKTASQSNRDFHGYSSGGNAQDDWRNDTSGVHYFHLVGVQAAGSTPLTLNELHVFQGFDTPESVLFGFDVSGAGDGTVPRVSASRQGAGGINLNAPGAQVILFDSGDDDLLEHTGLVTNPRVQTKVLQLLQGD